MSLINEALKRARVEAARQDAAAKGVPPSALPVYVPPRRRPWLAPVAGFLAGLTVVGMAAGAFWLVRRPTATADISASATSAEDAVASLEAPAFETPALEAPAASAIPNQDTEPAPRVSSSRPESPAAVESALASPEPPPSTSALSAARPLPRRAVQTPPAGTPAASSSAVPAPTASSSAVPSPAAPPAVAPPPTAVPSPAAVPAQAVPQPAVPPPASSDGDSGRTYLREAAPAGPSVKLEFIVWSESRPFAQINGQLLSIGQSVEGYTLLTVERERVELEGGDVRFWIRVR